MRVKLRYLSVYELVTCSPNSVTMLELVFLEPTGLGPLLPGAGGRSLESGGWRSTVAEGLTLNAHKIVTNIIMVSYEFKIKESNQCSFFCISEYSNSLLHG